MDPDHQGARHLRRHLRRAADHHRLRAQAAGALPGPLRAQPRRALRAHAAAGRGVKLAVKEPFRPATSVGSLYRIAPMIAILTAVAAMALLPFGDVQNIFGHEDRPLRHRRLDRPAVRLRLRRHRLLRDHARRLGLGLQVLVPGRDARRRAAHLLRGLQGLALVGVIITARHAVAHRDRPRPGGHVVLHPAVRRLPHLHDGVVRRDQPRAVRPRRGRRRAGRRLLHRVRRHGASSPTSSPSTPT